MHLGVGGFGIELGMARVILALKHALLVELLRFAAEQDDGFTLDVQTLVVVVVVLGGRDAITGKHNLACNATRRRKVKRREIGFKFGLILPGPVMKCQLVASAQLRHRGDRVTLEVAAANRLQPCLLILLGDIVGSLFKLGRTRSSTLELGRCKHLHVFKIVCRVQLRCREQGSR